MILDGHIHIETRTADRSRFLADLQQTHVDGGIIISLPPETFRSTRETAGAEARMDNVCSWCEGSPDLHPFFWIDPLAPDAGEQVTLATQKGIRGFKVICDRYAPGDERAMAVFSMIAATGRPILFHSGILWDGKPSSLYNRPAEFEALLAVKGLRFSMAHIAWPWCDEMIAVFGKFQNAQETNVELYIDTTPGTPPVYRQDVLTRLFNVGYDVKHRVFFGSDCSTHAYDGIWAGQWIERDKRILKAIGLDRDEVNAVFADNMKRFVGVLPAEDAPPPSLQDHPAEPSDIPLTCRTESRRKKFTPVVAYLPDATIDDALDNELRRLLTTCFTEPGDAVFQHRRYFVEPYPHRWVIRDHTDAIVAHVGVHDKHIERGGRRYRTAGIAEVCVHPDHRGRGYVKILFAHIHAWLSDQGFVFALLFGKPSIYGSCGYVEVANLKHGGDSEGWMPAGGMIKPLSKIPWPDGDVLLPGKKF